jgi:hypothetical protein
MDISFGKLILLAVLIVLIRPLLKIVFCLLAQTVLRGWLGKVGAKALDQQPDTIHLEPRPHHVWKDAAAVNALAAPLTERGFQDAGIHTVQEMPGMVLRFLVNPAERVAACIYEHPKVSTWLDTRPGQTKVNAPEMGSAALYERLLRERRAGDLEEWSMANVAGKFEAAYAREMTWRKKKGISGKEVARNIQADPLDRWSTEHSG